MADDQNAILIIGAGVGGLVLAQGLKHRGIPFKVFERNESISTKHPGYRFRCEAAGLEALEETVSPQLWDLIERTHAKDGPPVLTIIDPYTAEKKAEMNAVPDLSPRGQRNYPIDRQWWREVGCIGIEDDVIFGKEFESYELLEGPDGRRVRVHFTDKSTATGRLLVAADGVRSRVRRQLLPDLKLVDVDRMVMWGRTPWTPELRSQMPKEAFTSHFATALDSRHPTRSVLWSAIEWPGNLATISDGRLSEREDYVFWVLSTEAERSLMGRDTRLQDKLAWIETVTAEWDPAMQRLFKAQDTNALSVLPVYSNCPDLPQWDSNGCVTFVGDSIHAMAPTGGVGGRVAIEDARDLCMTIVSAKDSGDDAWREELLQYEQGVRDRASVAIEHSFKNAKFLWAGKDWQEYERTI